MNSEWCYVTRRHFRHITLSSIMPRDLGGNEIITKIDTALSVVGPRTGVSNYPGYGDTWWQERSKCHRKINTGRIGGGRNVFLRSRLS